MSKEPLIPGFLGWCEPSTPWTTTPYLCGFPFEHSAQMKIPPRDFCLAPFRLLELQLWTERNLHTLQNSLSSALDSRKENGAPSQPDRAVPLEAPVPGAELEAPGPPLERPGCVFSGGLLDSSLGGLGVFLRLTWVFKDELKRTPHVSCFLFFLFGVNWLSRPNIEQAKNNICFTYYVPDVGQDEANIWRATLKYFGVVLQATS